MEHKGLYAQINNMNYSSFDELPKHDLDTAKSQKS
jgi:hypothetical protein